MTRSLLARWGRPAFSVALVCSLSVAASPAAADVVLPPSPDVATDAASPAGAAPGARLPDEPPRERPPPSEEGLRDLPPPSMGLGELAGPLAKTMLMLGVVLLFAYLTLHKGLGKLVERQNIGRRVKVVERVALDPRRTLFLVDVDGKQMLLAAGEGGVVHLRDVDAPAPAADRTSSSFGQRFSEALKVRTSDLPPASTPAAPSSSDAASGKA